MEFLYGKCFKRKTTKYFLLFPIKFYGFFFGVENRKVLERDFNMGEGFVVSATFKAFYFMPGFLHFFIFRC